MPSSTDGVPGRLVGERGSHVNERPGPPAPGRRLRPLQEFLATSTAGGAALLIAVVVALAWVNSPWGESYTTVLATTITV